VGAPYRLLSQPFLRITTATLEPEEARALAADVAAVLRPARRTSSPDARRVQRGSDQV
jgi:hypothetical protein